jgi:hypothetical protein
MDKVGSISTRPVAKNNQLQAVYSSRQQPKNSLSAVQDPNKNKVENKPNISKVGQKIDQRF